MVIFVACFDVSFCTFSPSIYQNILIMYVLCIFVILVVSHFAFEGGTVVLIRPVPSYYLPFTFGITIIKGNV